MCSRYDVLVLDDIVNSHHHHRRADVKSTQTHQLGKTERKKEKKTNVNKQEILSNATRTIRFNDVLQHIDSQSKGKIKSTT